MRTLLASLVLVLVGVVVPTAATAGPSPDWKGSRHAQPSDYSWLDPDTPSDTYTITVVRGLTPAQAVRAVGTVRRRLSDQSPERAWRYVFKHTDPTSYESPKLEQVSKLGHAVVLYGPYQVVDDAVVAALSKDGIAASFFTDVNDDAPVVVARNGRVVREFDALFKPPTKGALPAEQGLDFGSRNENVPATAWAFLERLTLTHVSQTWFDGNHPTYVFEGLGD